ncbi:MAG TPA: hypothetical protein VMY43_00425 [Methanothrix sp.]|nr:hypothetical protein [Methanothrix sp.]
MSMRCRYCPPERGRKSQHGNSVRRAISRNTSRRSSDDVERRTEGQERSRGREDRGEKWAFCRGLVLLGFSASAMGCIRIPCGPWAFLQRPAAVRCMQE